MIFIERVSKEVEDAGMDLAYFSGISKEDMNPNILNILRDKCNNR